MYLYIFLESTQMYSRPVQVQDETEQISPVQPSAGDGENSGGDGEVPSGDGEDPGGDEEDPGGDGEDSGGDGAAGEGGDEGAAGGAEGAAGGEDEAVAATAEGAAAGGEGTAAGAEGAAAGGEGTAAGEGAAAGAEGAAANSEDFVTPVQVEESTEIYSEISDVEERRYCDFSSERNIEMNLELACVESEEMKRLYRNTEKVKFNISTYNLVVSIMINTCVGFYEQIQSEFEMGVS